MEVVGLIGRTLVIVDVDLDVVGVDLMLDVDVEVLVGMCRLGMVRDRAVGLSDWLPDLTECVRVVFRRVFVFLVMIVLRYLEQTL